MRIYLAGPMRGMPDYNFPAFFRYAHFLRKKGNEVFNPAEIGLPQDNIRDIFALEMKWICTKADAVCMMPGWSKSKGARAELAIAEALGLEVIHLLALDQLEASLDFPRTLSLEKPSQSEQQFSTISRSLWQQLPKSPSRDKDSTAPRGGTGLNLRTMPTLLSVTFWSGVLSTPMVCLMLLRWLGVL